LVNKTLEFAQEAGAETRLLDLREHPLPLYEAHDNYDGNAIVEQVTKLVDDCDALVLGSPEYHNCMSGAMKNFMDFLYREFAGKVFGLVSATGGSQGSGCFDNMRAAVHACHGWVLPYVTAANGRDFNAEGEIINERTLDRLRRMGRDLAIYGPLMNNQFKADCEQPADSIPGFAQWLG
jgi:NAD(P)H-dependent FMN reductase